MSSVTKNEVNISQYILGIKSKELKLHAQKMLNERAILNDVNRFSALKSNTMDKYWNTAFNNLMARSGKFNAMNGVNNNGYPGPSCKSILGVGGE